MNLNEFMLFLSYIIFGSFVTVVNKYAKDHLLKLITGILIYIVVIASFVILILASGG